jgi:hypothetical protein
MCEGTNDANCVYGGQKDNRERQGRRRNPGAAPCQAVWLYPGAQCSV